MDQGEYKRLDFELSPSNGGWYCERSLSNEPSHFANWNSNSMKSALRKLEFKYEEFRIRHRCPSNEFIEEDVKWDPNSMVSMQMGSTNGVEGCEIGTLRLENEASEPFFQKPSNVVLDSDSITSSLASGTASEGGCEIGTLDNEASKPFFQVPSKMVLDSDSMMSSLASDTASDGGLQEQQRLTSINQQSFEGYESVNKAKGKGMVAQACNSNVREDNGISPLMEFLSMTKETPARMTSTADPTSVAEAEVEVSAFSPTNVSMSRISSQNLPQNLRDSHIPIVETVDSLSLEKRTERAPTPSSPNLSPPHMESQPSAAPGLVETSVPAPSIPESVKVVTPEPKKLKFVNLDAALTELESILSGGHSSTTSRPAVSEEPQGPSLSALLDDLEQMFQLPVENLQKEGPAKQKIKGLFEQLLQMETQLPSSTRLTVYKMRDTFEEIVSSLPSHLKTLAKRDQLVQSKNALLKHLEEAKTKQVKLADQTSKGQNKVEELDRDIKDLTIKLEQLKEQKARIEAILTVCAAEEDKLVDNIQDWIKESMDVVANLNLMSNQVEAAEAYKVKMEKEMAEQLSSLRSSRT